MTGSVRINDAVVRHASNAAPHIASGVRPQEARALIMAAAHHLAPNTPVVQATDEQLASAAFLTPEQFQRAFDALELIHIFWRIEREGHGFPAGLTLHPKVAWRGDDEAERERMWSLYPEPLLA